MYRTCVQPPNEKRLSLLVFLGPPFEVVCTHKKNIYIYILVGICVIYVCIYILGIVHGCILQTRRAELVGLPWSAFRRCIHK